MDPTGGSCVPIVPFRRARPAAAEASKAVEAAKTAMEAANAEETAEATTVATTKAAGVGETQCWGGTA
jgi:hypothetical protein